MTVAEQTEHVLETELELYLKDQLSKESSGLWMRTRILPGLLQ